MGGKILLISWGPSGPQTWVQFVSCGGRVLAIIREEMTTAPTTAGCKRSQNYEMAKTFGQNCARHSSAVAKRAGLHLTFAGRANEKYRK